MWKFGKTKESPVSYSYNVPDKNNRLYQSDCIGVSQGPKQAARKEERLIFQLMALEVSVYSDQFCSGDMVRWDFTMGEHGRCYSPPSRPETQKANTERG